MQIANVSIEAPPDDRVAVSRAGGRRGSEGTLVGLIGMGIQPSRMPALHEREGAAQGLAYIYRLVDLEVLRLGVEALPELLVAAAASPSPGSMSPIPVNRRSFRSSTSCRPLQERSGP